MPINQRIVLIEFKCSSCDKSLKVSDKHAGKKAKCPKCSSPVRVPALPEPEADDFGFGDDQGLDLGDLGALAKGTTATEAVSLDDATKPCPKCKNPVSFTAALCIQCGHQFNKAQIVSAKAKAEADAYKKENSTTKKAGRAGRAGAGVAAAFIAAGVFTGIWAWVGSAVGWDFGWLSLMAWPMGMAAGVAAGQVGRKPAELMGYAAGGATVCGILAAKAIIAAAVVANWSSDVDFRYEGQFQEMVEAGEFGEDQAFAEEYLAYVLEQSWESDFYDELSDEEYELTDDLDLMVSERLEELSEDEAQAISDRFVESNAEYVEWYTLDGESAEDFEQATFWTVFTLSLIRIKSLIFFTMAISTAYGLAIANSSDS